MGTCRTCYAPVPDGATACPRCGTPIGRGAAPRPPAEQPEPEWMQTGGHLPRVRPDAHPGWAAPPRRRSRAGVWVGAIVGLAAIGVALGMALVTFVVPLLVTGSTPSPTVTVTASASPSAAEPSFPQDTERCSPTVAAGANTSCGFALAVADVVFAAPSYDEPFAVDAASPVTGKTYTMACALEPGQPEGAERVLVRCTGGRDASVYVIVTR